MVFTVHSWIRKSILITRVFKFKRIQTRRWLVRSFNSKDGSQGHSNSKMALKTIRLVRSGWAQKDMEVDEAVKKGGTDIGSYGGYLVRARVRITITNWKDVSPTLKKNLWISLKRQEEGDHLLERTVLWVATFLQGKDGNYANDATKEVAERITKKANSLIPPKTSKKENAEVTSRAPVRNHTWDLGKGRSCSLAVDFKSNVVAKGIVYEELGPETKLHNVPLGQYNSHVAVGKILEAYLCGASRLITSAFSNYSSLFHSSEISPSSFIPQHEIFIQSDLPGKGTCTTRLCVLTPNTSAIQQGFFLTKMMTRVPA
ncbi:hypothetical protein IFM89_022218 [Coptis chinensis]|uniref:Uncharacterized protein n=1 Tax=Coptis chinensis TaxID=261450 RepID=A0A835M3L3_9MAGN|nr:hypothetical protein IFM89_022218 [Coptis chinensis]